MSYRVVGAVALGTLLGCADEPRFLSLESLCSALAADLCDARAGCCGLVDTAQCEKDEAARCVRARMTFEGESTLTYDAVSASRTRTRTRAALDACGPEPVLADFFTGGLSLGAPCERDTQCARGVCAGAPRVCSEPVAIPLCAAR